MSDIRLSKMKNPYGPIYCRPFSSKSIFFTKYYFGQHELDDEISLHLLSDPNSEHFKMNMFDRLIQSLTHETLHIILAKLEGEKTCRNLDLLPREIGLWG